MNKYITVLSMTNVISEEDWNRLDIDLTNKIWNSLNTTLWEKFGYELSDFLSEEEKV